MEESAAERAINSAKGLVAAAARPGRTTRHRGSRPTRKGAGAGGGRVQADGESSSALAITRRPRDQLLRVR
jgi:hypothetical protein